MENDNKNLQCSSIAEIISGLENKALNPKEFTKHLLGKCAITMKSRGYSNLEIGELLQIAPRTVQRHVQKIRESNSLIAKYDYQKHSMNEIVGNFSAQYSRLIRLSYSTAISDSERIRSIYAACQVQKDMVELLIKLGYFSEINTKEALIKEEPQLLKFEAGELKSVPMEAVFSVLPSDDQATMISYKNSLFKNVLKQIREKQLELLRSSVEACKKDSTFETKSGQ